MELIKRHGPEIRQRYHNGETLREIAEAINASHSAVWQVLKKLREPRRRIGPRIASELIERRNNVFNLCLQGLSQAEIAKRTGSGYRQVSRDEQAIGVPSRRSKYFKSWLERMQGLITPASDATSSHADTGLSAFLDVSSLSQRAAGHSPRSQQGAAFFCSNQ